MNAQFSLSIPDETMATLTIHAKVGEFRKLLAQIEMAPEYWHWPLGDMRDGLKQVLREAEQKFHAHVNTNDKP